MPESCFTKRRITREEERELDIKIDFTEGVVKRDSSYVEALEILGEDYTRRGRFVGGSKVDKPFSQLRPADPLGPYNLAHGFLLTGNFNPHAALNKALMLDCRDFDCVSEVPDRKLRLNPRYKIVRATIRRMQVHTFAMIITIFIMVAGPSFHAQADCNVQVSPDISWNGDANDANSTNFSCGASQKLQAQLLVSSNGSYAYCEFDRNIIDLPGKWPPAAGHESIHASGAIVGQSFWSPQNNVEVYAVGRSDIRVDELVLLQYIPDSQTDAPPTSISFQQVYLLQGQLTGEVSVPIRVYVGEVSEQIEGVGNPGGLNVPAVTFSFNNVVLGPVISAPIGASGPLQPGLSIGFTGGGPTTFQTWLDVIADWVDPAWVYTNSDGYGYDSSYTQPDLYNVSCYFSGITNVVDQNNNPVPLNKLYLWWVDPANTNMGIGMPAQSDLSVPQQFVSLQVISATNGLTMQWPLYGSNFQLQTTSDLLNGVWTTNALPVPIQAGPFLQVTVPMTNNASFFRLVQTN